ncbi:MAG: class I SAM-dependent methyltransferase [Candidatus Terrybacteria bacterium]|nr:class I SAM-dependent methyltransferase [Candidatus Terrybacteria bacterium]
MLNKKWNDLKQAYYFRSIKYKDGKYLVFNRKHEGVARYLDKAIENLRHAKDKIIFCDAGCGNGIYIKYIKDNYLDIEIYGFDFSEEIVKVAVNNTGVSSIIKGNLEEIPFENNKFDIILCTQVIEHLLDDKKGMAELCRVLKKGGYLVISTDNKHNFISKLLNLPNTIFSVPYKIIKAIFFKKSDKYFPHKSYSIKEFKNLINSTQFKIEEISTFRFSAPFPFYKLKFARNIADFLERIAIRANLFKKSGDILISLCKKK